MHIESGFWLWSSSLCRATWRVDVLFFQMFMSWHLLADNLLNDAAVCVGINSESISWSGWAHFPCAGSLAFDVFTLLIYVRVKYDRPCLSISVQVLWAELSFLFFLMLISPCGVGIVLRCFSYWLLVNQISNRGSCLAHSPLIKIISFLAIFAWETQHDVCLTSNLFSILLSPCTSFILRIK